MVSHGKLNKVSKHAYSVLGVGWPNMWAHTSFPLSFLIDNALIRPDSFIVFENANRSCRVAICGRVAFCVLARLDTAGFGDQHAAIAVSVSCCRFAHRPVSLFCSFRDMIRKQTFENTRRSLVSFASVGYFPNLRHWPRFESFDTYGLSSLFCGCSF